MLRLLAEITEGPAHPNLWNPTILGVLVVLSAIGLFCGSAYLLLATNLGARLGFLVAFASLTGFMVLLTTLWWTSGNSGIDPPHGRSPSWKVVDVVSDVGQSKITGRAEHREGRHPRHCDRARQPAPRDGRRARDARTDRGRHASGPAVPEVLVVARLPHRLQGLQATSSAATPATSSGTRRSTRSRSSAPPSSRRRPGAACAIRCRTSRSRS